MSIVTGVLKAINDGRQKLVDVGLRNHRVYLRAGQWDGGEIHLGTLTNTDVEITPRPEVLESGPSSLRVSNITPPYPGGGWQPATLLPDVASGSDYYFVVTNPRGDSLPYTVTDIDSTSPFRVTLTLQRLEPSSPNY